MKRLLLAAAAFASMAAAEPAADLYSQGVAARQAGDTARAIALLQQAVAAEPANSDAQLQLGLAHLAAGHLDEAEAAFRRTLVLAPDYADARIGLARVEQRRGNAAAALRTLQPIGPGNSDAALLRAQLQTVSPAYRWQLNVDGSYTSLEGGTQPDWREGAAQVRFRASEGMELSGSVEVSRRFGETDTYGELRIDQRLGDGASVYVMAGATPGADFRARWQVGAGGSVRLHGGPRATVLTLDARQARYRAGDIQTLTPGIDQYLTERLWVSGRWINIFDEDGERRSGWLGRGDWQATGALRLFVGAADAPDVDEGVVVDTFSLFGGASIDISERTSLRLSVSHVDREAGPDRVQVGLGMGFRF